MATARARLPHPLPKMHFRVFIDAEEVDLHSVSPLHLPDAAATDPAIRQTVTLRRAVGPSRIFYDWNQSRVFNKDDVRIVTICWIRRAAARSISGS